jgi:flagellar biosynthesis protein FlhB
MSGLRREPSRTAGPLVGGALPRRASDKPQGVRVHLQRFSNAGDKTEKATPKKRQDLRKKGQVNQSRELPSILLLLALFLSMRVFGPFVYRELVATFHFFIQESLSTMDFGSSSDVMRIASYSLLQIVKMSGPFFLVAMLIGAVGSVVQVGFMFTLEPLKPKFSKLNPLSGIKRMFSARSFFEMLKAVAKVGMVLWVAWAAISAELGTLANLMDLDFRSSIGYMANLVLDVSLKVCFALLVIAAVDFAFQYRQHEKEIRMTKQEIKEEYKQMEGSPEIKSRIRQKQREISMRRMMQEVPKADVVITNPTHLAVAVRYRPEDGDAPIVLAKGADFMAARMREIAKENGVRLVENKPLAQALYQQVEVGKPVPPELYKAVAEVLAFVYGLQGRTAEAATRAGRPGTLPRPGMGEANRTR